MCEKKLKETGLPDRAGCRHMSNVKCEFFPCHETEDTEDFNCLFCFCPLYALGNRCGGNFKYTEEGIKDCSDCLIPHGRDAWEHISERLESVMEMTKNDRGEGEDGKHEG